MFVLLSLILCRDGSISGDEESTASRDSDSMASGNEESMARMSCSEDEYKASTSMHYGVQAVCRA